VRIPAHARALELLRVAGIPVAAPSANRFGHVSPTHPEHVMDDLGHHEIMVLRPEAICPADGSSLPSEQRVCEVGIESTVVKVDAESRRLLLLRRGGVPEAELERWVNEMQCGFSFAVQPQKHSAPPRQGCVGGARALGQGQQLSGKQGLPAHCCGFICSYLCNLLIPMLISVLIPANTTSCAVLASISSANTC
jgi:hypothetical protein